MSDVFWIVLGIILTSPFWMVILLFLIGVIGSLIETFLNLFKRK